VSDPLPTTAETGSGDSGSGQTGSGDTEATVDTSVQPATVDSVAMETELGNGTAEPGYDADSGVAIEMAQAEGVAGSDATLEGESEKADGDGSSKKTWCFADIKRLWRKFNIDLMPKVQSLRPAV